MITDGMIDFLAAPRLWPKALRRLYVLTFPVSIPLHLTALFILLVAALSEAIAKTLVQMWSEP